MSIPHAEYISIKEKSIEGRYVTASHIDSFLHKNNARFKIEVVGKSVKGEPIHAIHMGSGPHRVLMWSQMHGNESTTTKAVLDLVNFLETNEEVAKSILQCCTLKIVPILNPDGAAVYTRANANGVDLNRDASDRSEPESKVLRKIYDGFDPHFGFNLHDQRTIFNVGGTPKPATVSFLAPAHDEERSISKTRGMAMRLIAAMDHSLQKLIPGQVGRYDDAFNANCVGDAFQMLGTPTILFEAGHFPNDYKRERTREFIFFALLTALQTIAGETIDQYAQEAYFAIPENNKLFFDVLVHNPHLANPNYSEESSVGILYREILESDHIEFYPKLTFPVDPRLYFGHETYDCAVALELVDLKKQSFWTALSLQESD